MVDAAAIVRTPLQAGSVAPEQESNGAAANATAVSLPVKLKMRDIANAYLIGFVFLQMK